MEKVERSFYLLGLFLENYFQSFCVVWREELERVVTFFCCFHSAGQGLLNFIFVEYNYLMPKCHFLDHFCAILFIYSQFLIVITKYWRLQTLKYFFQCIILTIVLYVHSLCQRRVAEGCLTTTFSALNSYCVHMVRYCCLTISNCFDETKLHV